jgi:hypothetical protein
MWISESPKSPISAPTTILKPSIGVPGGLATRRPSLPGLAILAPLPHLSGQATSPQSNFGLGSLFPEEESGVPMMTRLSIAFK